MNQHQQEVIALLRSIDASLRTLAAGVAPPPPAPAPATPNPPARPPSTTPWPPPPAEGKQCEGCGAFMKPDSQYKLCFKCGQAARALQADCPKCGKPNSVKPPYTQCYTCNQQPPQAPPQPPQPPAPQYAPRQVTYPPGEEPF